MTSIHEKTGDSGYGTLSPALLADLASKGVDISRTLEVLRRCNGTASEAAPGEAPSVPEPHSLRGAPHMEDPRVLDAARPLSLTLDKGAARRLIDELGVEADIAAFAEERSPGVVTFSPSGLRTLGVRLYPRLAYGVLNGGSATSYADRKRNAALDDGLFETYGASFDRLSALCRDEPKGVTPAFVEADGSAGPSFLLLKMRALLIAALEYRISTGDEKAELLPFFQMTSRATAEPLSAAYAAYRGHPLLAELIERTGVDPTEPRGAVQPLLAALTHKADGLPRRIFDRAGGRADTGIALPGGHGESFRVLASTYRELQRQGVRWAYLGNVDNSGFFVDPSFLAVSALKGAQATFEFSYRTEVDVKGGVLFERDDGRLTVADIGQAVRWEEVLVQEEGGRPVLFNCATGLFDLDWLVPRLEAIADGLPIRISEQDKDLGRYAQAEVTTWESIPMVEEPLILAVPKERRFIAAKMLMETLLSSPDWMGSPGKKVGSADGAARGSGVAEAAGRIREGFGRLLPEVYGLVRNAEGQGSDGEGRRRPLGVDELVAALGGRRSG